MVKSIYVLSLIVLGVLSCSSKSQQDSLQFNVDKSLLAENYSIDSLNFNFAPPKGFQMAALTSKSAATQKFSGDQLQAYSLSIKELFQDSSSNSFCYICLLQWLDRRAPQYSLDIESLNDSGQYFRTK